MKMDESVQGVMFIILAVFLLNHLLGPSRTDPADTTPLKIAHPDSVAANTDPVAAVDLDEIKRDLAPAPVVRNDVVDRYRREVESLIKAEQYLDARAFLLERAASANQAGDKRTLGYLLALLGEVSTASRDLGAAQMYLEESLATFTDMDDSIGEAYTYMQLGRMHIKSRAIARHAGEAYNLLLLARYQLSRFQYHAAESNLRRVIEASLAIERFGTAASALKSLARVKRETGQTHDAEQALFEAAELHAASGREIKANEMLDSLIEQGVDPYLVAKHRTAVSRALKQFHIDTRQVLAARDYRSLYYQFRNAGSFERAWQFRVKAAEVLAQTSKRAMYYRQPDVMAILYNSNFAMDHAANYVNQASALYASQGETDFAERADSLGTLIF